MNYRLKNLFLLAISRQNSLFQGESHERNSDDLVMVRFSGGTCAPRGDGCFADIRWAGDFDRLRERSIFRGHDRGLAKNRLVENTQITLALQAVRNNLSHHGLRSRGFFTF